MPRDPLIGLVGKPSSGKSTTLNRYVCFTKLQRIYSSPAPLQPHRRELESRQVVRKHYSGGLALMTLAQATSRKVSSSSICHRL